MPDLSITRADETRVDKPWGYEIRWAITDRYLGKILHVNRGEALSLQYHERKDEWLLVSKGTIDIEIGRLDGELEKVRMSAGDSVHMPPLTRHRLTAIDDADIFEVSTPEIDDVVRLEDRYGRATPPPRGSRREPGGTSPQGGEDKLPRVK
jgi:mannose-6-phosphate isomerase-like protein (cupin superfamily)